MLAEMAMAPRGCMLHESWVSQSEPASLVNHPNNSDPSVQLYRQRLHRAGAAPSHAAAQTEAVRRNQPGSPGLMRLPAIATCLRQRSSCPTLAGPSSRPASGRRLCGQRLCRPPPLCQLWGGSCSTTWAPRPCMPSSRCTASRPQCAQVRSVLQLTTVTAICMAIALQPQLLPAWQQAEGCLHAADG